MPAHWQFRMPTVIPDPSVSLGPADSRSNAEWKKIRDNAKQEIARLNKELQETQARHRQEFKATSVKVPKGHVGRLYAAVLLAGKTGTITMDAASDIFRALAKPLYKAFPNLKRSKDYQPKGATVSSAGESAAKTIGSVLHAGLGAPVVSLSIREAFELFKGAKLDPIFTKQLSDNIDTFDKHAQRLEKEKGTESAKLKQASANFKKSKPKKGIQVKSKQIRRRSPVRSSPARRTKTHSPTGRDRSPERKKSPQRTRTPPPTKRVRFRDKTTERVFQKKDTRRPPPLASHPGPYLR